MGVLNLNRFWARTRRSTSGQSGTVSQPLLVVLDVPDSRNTHDIICLYRLLFQLKHYAAQTEAKQMAAKAKKEERRVEVDSRLDNNQNEIADLQSLYYELNDIVQEQVGGIVSATVAA